MDLGDLQPMVEQDPKHAKAIPMHTQLLATLGIFGRRNISARDWHMQHIVADTKQNHAGSSRCNNFFTVSSYTDITNKQK